MLALLLALQLNMPDAAHLRRLADSAGVPPAAVLSVAWEESRANLSPRLRGHYCWWSVRPDSATVIVHHEPDCEVGRFQIKPSTGRRRCPEWNIWTYEGNTHCFVKMFAADVAELGVERAITRHNGSGLAAREYTQRVLASIGRIKLEEWTTVEAVRDGVSVGPRRQ